MFKKLIFSSVILIIVSFGATAQQTKIKNLPAFDYKDIHFGFSLGTNSMNMHIVSANIPDANGNIWQAEIVQPTPGFQVGLISSFNLNDYFSFRFVPGIALGQRDITFVSKDNSGTAATGSPHLVQVKSTYIETPLLLKYKAYREGNTRPYMIGGFNARFDLARQNTEDILLRPIDLSVEMGLGSDFYLEEFRLGVEFRFALGLNDVLFKDRPQTNDFDPTFNASLNSLFSRFFILAFNFE